MTQQVSAQQYRSAITGEVWECLPVSVAGPFATRTQPRDVSPESIVRLAGESLNAPLDYPPMIDAIVPGDRVALAVDPSVPQVTDVIAGVATAISIGGASGLSVVMWEEASDALLQQVRDRLDSLSLTIGSITVTRHQSKSRPDLRYVAADQSAEPVYLSRELVDADFTLPIIAARRGDAADAFDKNGVFPMFADAATQQRCQVDAPEFVADAGWLLGVQLLMLVSSDAVGAVSRILSGTPDAIRRELRHFHVEEESTTILRADLVIASLDGDATMQSWPNVARSVLAASRQLAPGGSIVVWSHLSERPSPVWQRGMIDFDPDRTLDEPIDAPEMESSEFEEELEDSTALAWGGTGQQPWATVLARIGSECRVWLHSELPAKDVEQLGLGVVESVAQLTRLAAKMGSAGVLRAAQFHSESIPQENSR